MTLKRILLAIVVFLVLSTPVWAQPGRGLTFHQVQVYDELGRKDTSITSVDIYNPGTTTSATIYADRGFANAITLPMTSVTANTTLSNGFFYWWGPDGFDYTMTDGTRVMNNASGPQLDGSVGTIILPTWLQAVSTTTYVDSANLSMGTGGDWVINAGTTADLITFTPATNGAVWRVGTADGVTCADLQWYTASGVGLLISQSADTFGITGLTTNINVASNYATNINTSTSTGAVTIGSGTAGAIAIDTTSTVTINSDGTMALSTTDAASDITLTAPLSSIVLTATEAVDNAIVLTATGAAGGIDITSLGDIDITTTGAAGEDITITNTGGSLIASATEDIADAIFINATTGGIDITADGAAGKDLDLVCTSGSVNITAGESGTDSIVITSSIGGIQILAAGAAATEDITLTATGSSVNINATENAAAAITLLTNGGTSETITITNTQGTAAGAIALTSLAGGVTITGTGAAAGDITLVSGDDTIITATGALTITASDVITVKGAMYPDSIIKETDAANETLDILGDIGKWHQVSTDAVVITLPAVGTGLTYKVMNIGTDGAVEIHLDTNAADKFLAGCGLATATDDGDKMTNSKATAHKGDYIVVTYGTADGWYIIDQCGVWVDGGA